MRIVLPVISSLTERIRAGHGYIVAQAFLPVFSLCNKLLMRSPPPDDISFVIVNEDLIQQAMSKAGSSDLDDVRTAIEGYRVCITTARRLLHNPPMETQLREVLECAVF